MSEKILKLTSFSDTVFISYTGEALDYKAPLKKSIKAVGKAALDVARMFYPEISSVKSNLGWEQEYSTKDDFFFNEEEY